MRDISLLIHVIHIFFAVYISVTFSSFFLASVLVVALIQIKLFLCFCHVHAVLIFSVMEGGREEETAETAATSFGDGGSGL